MGGTGGTKLTGSSAAQNVSTPSLHCSDSTAPTLHNPSPVGVSGSVPMSNGTIWVATALSALLALLVPAFVTYGDNIVVHNGEVVWEL